MMQAELWLKLSSERLEQAGIGTARLDCLVLLEDATGKERAYLLAHPEMELASALIKKLDAQIKRRAQHEPLAYIRKKTEFYGREFCLDQRVLEPRPESETMIELLKKAVSSDQQLAIGQPVIVDVGTGSGAIAITAKLEWPKAIVIGTDIDKDCLVVARRNARLLHSEVEFLEGNLLEPLESSGIESSIILANLPYVPDHFQINPAAMSEPRIAIFGGSDGLDLYRKFFKQIKKLNSKPNLILTESMPPQHGQLAEIAQKNGFQLRQTDDFIQVFKNP
jgi:release factor glutamine methyltransferase